MRGRSIHFLSLGKLNNVHMKKSIILLLAVSIGLTSCHSGDQTGKSSGDTMATLKKKFDSSAAAGPSAPRHRLKASSPADDKVYNSVEQVPEFPGGMAALMKYLTNNIRYPATAREDNIQGRVVLQFIVDKDGSILHIVIQRDLPGGCGAEAVRVVKGMPKWKPGRQNNQAVKVYYTLPVTFKLQE